MRVPPQLSFAALPLVLACGGPKPPERACNGHAELCDRPLDQVTLPSTHNSMSNRDENWLGPNHEHGIEDQLAAGVRGMLLDTYVEEGEVLLCHGYCSLGSRPLAEVFTVFVDFLEAHPDEVLFLILQDAAGPEAIGGVAEATGLIEQLYVHPEGAPWPSLATLIDAGTPVVLTGEGGSDSPAWYHNFWDLGSDTPYSFRSEEEFSCGQNRGDPEAPLFLVNHWISDPLPNPEAAKRVNTAEVLGGRARQCWDEVGKQPTLLAVDFFSTGDLFEVVDELNGVGDTDAP